MCSTWPKLLSLKNNVIQLLQKLFSFNDNNYSTSAMYGELILTNLFFGKNVLKILGHSKCRHTKSLRTVSSQIRFITHPVPRPQQMASEDGTTGREGAWSSGYGSRVLQAWMIHCSCRLPFFPFSKSEKKTKIDPRRKSRGDGICHFSDRDELAMRSRVLNKQRGIPDRLRELNHRTHSLTIRVSSSVLFYVFFSDWANGKKEAWEILSIWNVQELSKRLSKKMLEVE